MRSYIGGLKNWYNRKSNHRMPSSFRPTKKPFSHKDFQNAKLSSCNLSVSNAKEAVEPLPWSKLGEQWWLKDEQRWTYCWIEKEIEIEKKKHVNGMYRLFFTTDATDATVGVNQDYYTPIYSRLAMNTCDSCVPIGGFR